ncbi:MAG: chemotaxis protein CheW [Defluviitaleaceae bacterium]|nr:chemotaxis protein CheW [Defluviitaleaceae bacterium]MCL2262171.1 chemotaxis protein CheW [Defluviitaleaceae bacterium]
MATVQNMIDDERHDDTIKDQYLTFAIEGEDYGVEIAYVKEIIKMTPITKVPEMPNFIEGLINLRGDLIGVIDVRKRFDKQPKEHDEETCIIVIMYEDYTLGMIVDAVQETAIIPKERIFAPPSAKLSYANQFIRNIGKVGEEVKLLLDVERFLAQE